MFTSIIGQDRAVELIGRQLASGRVPHAYLFTGIEGTGRKKTALETAKFLNCLDPRTADGRPQPCDSCVSCRKIDKGLHPDVHLINFSWQAAVLEEDPEKQSELKIDAMREMQKQLSLKTAEGKWKVFIVERAEKLSNESRDCLLKTLEEPTRDSLIILLVNSLNALPKTIVSRCQCIKFRRLSAVNISKIIGAMSGELDAEVPELADGSVSEALKIKESGEKAGLLLELWDKMKKGSADSLQLLAASKAVSRNREDTEEFISRLLLLIQADFEKNGKLKDAAEFVLQCKKSLRYNVNQNLVLDLILLKTKEMLENKSANDCHGNAE